MSNGETKYFAVTANNIMWMLIIIVLFCMSVFIFMSHKIDIANQRFIKQTIDFSNELSNLKIKHAEIRSDVDWNEDQLVNINTWKEKVYQETIIGGNHAERKASGK